MVQFECAFVCGLQVGLAPNPPQVVNEPGQLEVVGWAIEVHNGNEVFEVCCEGFHVVVDTQNLLKIDIFEQGQVFQKEHLRTKVDFQAVLLEPPVLHQLSFGVNRVDD